MFVITFGSQVIWQYKIDVFPVAVRAPAIISCGGFPGGSEYNFWSFCNTHLYRYSLQCTYCTNSRRRFDSARRDRAENCNCSCGEGCGGRAVVARRARRSRDTTNVRNVPTHMGLCCLYICCSLLTVCVLLSASRDEEVVGVGRSQVLQPGGEFN